jgi:hypothetical protein
MKVGIFGDSFSGSNGATSWTTLLKQSFDQVENFSEGGSSLFHGYKHFLNDYKKFDTIVFTLTAPGRLYTDIPPSDLCICNLFVVEHLLGLDDIKQSIHYDAIKAAEHYYMYLQNEEFDLFVHNSIIEKIIKLTKEHNIKLILLPCMLESKRSMPEVFSFCAEEFNLSQVNNLERDFYKLPHTAMHFERKGRLQNHISDENNIVLADIVTRIINNEDIKISINLFDPCPATDVNVYYNMEEINKL